MTKIVEVKNPADLLDSLENVTELLNSILRDIWDNPRYPGIPQWLKEDIAQAHEWVDDQIDYNIIVRG